MSNNINNRIMEQKVKSPIKAFKDNESGKWGAINTKGETVIPFEFGYIIGFHEGLPAFIGDNHLYGFIDESGNQVIPPIWDFCSGFENGLAWVRNSEKKYGYIDKQGNVVIPCQWAGAESFFHSPSFAIVRDEQDNYFKIDRHGNVVCQFGPKHPYRWNNQPVTKKELI